MFYHLYLNTDNKNGRNKKNINILLLAGWRHRMPTHFYCSVCHLRYKHVIYIVTIPSRRTSKLFSCMISWCLAVPGIHSCYVQCLLHTLESLTGAGEGRRIIRGITLSLASSPSSRTRPSSALCGLRGMLLS